MSETLAKTKSASPAKAKMNTYPVVQPALWHALRVTDWFKLCARHGFRIHPLRMPMAAAHHRHDAVQFIGGALLQQLWFGRYIEGTRIETPPVFIVGHWRSGTTLLHELLSHDSRFATPNTYQCMAPHHTYVTEWLIGKHMGWLLPKERPMDNMAAGFQRPQEDEFAILALGAPTPYARMAFPNDKPDYTELLNLDETAPADLERFQRALTWFMKLITLQAKQKQLLLKSPPHTGRVGHFARWFPGAKFIHIARNPFSLFPSTMRLWESLDDVQGLQVARHKQLREYVFDCFERMYRGYEKQRSEIPAGDLYELKYEDLVKDPIGQCELIYQKLKLGNFEPVRKKIAKHMEGQKDYKTNKHQLDAETEAEIRRRWAGYFQRFGYE